MSGEYTHFFLRDRKMPYKSIWTINVGCLNDSYNGDAATRGFGCHDQWLAMAFAQLTYRESLPDLESSLHARTALLYPGNVILPVRPHQV
jgi:hypothetical protein